MYPFDLLLWMIFSKQQKPLLSSLTEESDLILYILGHMLPGTNNKHLVHIR